MVRLFVCLLCIYGISGCTSSRTKEIENLAERIDHLSPDSAFYLLSRIEAKGLIEEKEQAAYALLYTRCLYKSKIRLESDSLILFSWKYYEGNKKKREAMEAAFYLSKIYEAQDSLRLAMFYAEKGRKYAEQAGDIEWMGLLYRETARLYRLQHNFSEAIDFYRKTIHIFQGTPWQKEENRTMADMAYCFLQKGELDSALVYEQLATQGAKKQGDKSLAHYLKGNLISIYARRGERDTVRRLACELCEEQNCGKAYCLVLNDTSGEKREVDIFPKREKIDSLWMCLPSFYVQIRLLQRKKNPPFEGYSIKTIHFADTLFSPVEEEYIFQKEEQDRSKLLAGQKQENSKLLRQREKLENENFWNLVLLYVLFAAIAITGSYFGWKIRRHKRLVQEKEKQMGEYLTLITALKEQRKTVQDRWLERLDEKNEQERRLKEALIKRLDVIRQLAHLSFQYGQSKQTSEIFCRKIKELLYIGFLTQDLLADLIEIVNRNQGGIIDFLKRNYDLTREELEVCSFLIAGFTPQEMSVLYNIKVSNVYLRCSRLGKRMGLSVPLASFLREMAGAGHKTD